MFRLESSETISTKGVKLRTNDKAKGKGFGFLGILISR